MTSADPGSGVNWTPTPEGPSTVTEVERRRPGRVNPYFEQLAGEAGSLMPDLPAVAMPGRLQDVDHWGRSARWRELSRVAYEPMYRYYFRVDAEGLENIPTEGGALLVANHSGVLPPDAAAIMHAIETEMGRPVYGLAEHLFKTIPYVSVAWARVGGVSAHPENAHRLLHDEEQLALVFPEGAKGPAKTFRERYQLRRFGRGGFVEVAMRAGVPVVPIAFVGAEEAMPNFANVPGLAKLIGLPFAPIPVPFYLPAKMHFKVLPPVNFPDKANLPRYSKGRVMEYADTIRDMIQQEIYAMLRDRRSVWFG